jgi:osmotically-inducible protein OsmY
VASAPASDALLVQIVRSALGRRSRVPSRINVSSCSFVVTLHGAVDSAEERDGIEAAVRAVPGVSGVVNKLGVAQVSIPRGAVSERVFRGI